MTTLTLQQTYDACQTNKTAWLNRKTELAAAMQEYQELCRMTTHQAPADYSRCVT